MHRLREVRRDMPCGISRQRGHGEIGGHRSRCLRIRRVLRGCRGELSRGCDHDRGMTLKEFVAAWPLLKKQVKGLELPWLEDFASIHQDPFKILISCILSLRTQDRTTGKASAGTFLEGAERHSGHVRTGHLQAALAALFLMHHSTFL